MPPDRRPPNLLLVVCDEMRWCELGAYGSTLRRRDGSPLTPALDGLAAAGVRAEHGVTNAPVCMPARTAILSGQHARTCCGHVTNSTLRFERRDGAESGGRGWLFDTYAPREKLALPDPTLPELLRSAGYHTRVIGKWHVDAWPHAVGFDRYCIPRTHHADAAQLYTDDGGPEFCPGNLYDGRTGPDFEADRACAFVENPDADDPGHGLDDPAYRPDYGPTNAPGAAGRPWFLHLNLGPPHMPLADMPAAYQEMVDPASVELRGNVPTPFDDAEHAETYKVYRWDYRQYLSHLPHADALPAGFDLRALTALYLGGVAWVDDAVGRVLASLEASGAADNTLVAFTSDHGDLLGSHGLFGKSTLWEESIRVPMLFRGPGLPAGRVASGGVASLVDLAPTLLAAAGVRVPDHMQGVDLGPGLRGDAPLPAAAHVDASEGVGVRTATHSYGLPRRGERSADARTVAPDAAPLRFTDLAADPLQLAPLSPSDAPGVAAELDAKLRAWDADTPWMEPGAVGGRPVAAT